MNSAQHSTTQNSHKLLKLPLISLLLCVHKGDGKRSGSTCSCSLSALKREVLAQVARAQSCPLVLLSKAVVVWLSTALCYKSIAEFEAEFAIAASVSFSTYFRCVCVCVCVCV